MKVRNGFVSNSSSSSFVCDVSGESFEVYDGEGVYHCCNGHGFCSEYLLDAPAACVTTEEKRNRLVNDAANEPAKMGFALAPDEKIVEWYDAAYDDNIPDDESNLPEARCPICMFKEPCDRELIEFLLSEMKADRVSMLQLLKNKFGTYRNFLDSLRK